MPTTKRANDVEPVPTTALIDRLLGDLIRSADVDASHAILLAIGRGLRRQEIIELRWRDVGLDKGTITV